MGRRIIQPGDGDPKHGTVYGYSALQCGRQPNGTRRACTACQEANATKSRTTKRHRRIIQPGDGDHRHGTVNGYSNLRCGLQPDGTRKTCKPCKRAWAEAHMLYMNANPQQREKNNLRMSKLYQKRRTYFGTPYEQLPRS